MADGNNYEAFVTADQNIRYQQNLTGRRIAVLVLMDNLWPNVRRRAADIGDALDRLQPGDYRELEV